ncbi:DUF4366 domain-containing protein [Sinanaerobacter chloroacetimidivorans]|uniref:DUF4366 domain-containing protein n=1 Tax=Sinanaerobacter chloroacetimidivorans TaxID=2818044 RepID=A0A8J7W2Y6_9FIRM|nr:DUF4366 domain-containing protein [Sinanaerobacter chloroacetimidivorans]MBR0598141.1 DUF4366 domain-containing protein [Sinanaerobacter chloroacetimidivorans]
MKMSKKWPRASAMLFAMLLCLSVFSVPAYAKTDESKAITASSDPIEEAVVPTVEPAASEPVKETEPEAAVPLTPEGNLTIVDDLEGEQTEDKQFITVKTKAGNTFYLIIDRGGKENNVYFLNLVDEADLRALMEEDGNLEPLPGEGAVPTVPEPEPEPTPEPETEVEEPLPAKSMNPVPILMVLLVILGGTGLWYFKLRKPKPSIKGSTNLDEYSFDDDDFEEKLLVEEDQESSESERDDE